MTEEQQSQVAMFMRVVEFMRKNEHVIAGHQEMEAIVASVKQKVADLFELLTEEEKDSLLQQYALELEHIKIRAEKKAKKIKK